MDLRQRRLFFGMTQEELARKLRIKVSTLSNWENGLHEPRPQKRLALAEHLRWSLEEVYAALPVKRRAPRSHRRSPRPTIVA
jgi:transcriptional regulator with XRE-family HTH domain